MVFRTNIEDSVRRYFDIITDSNVPLQLSFDDKNNKQFNSLCKKMDSLYKLRKKFKTEFFKSIADDQYYFDIYQVIKQLKLKSPSSIPAFRTVTNKKSLKYIKSEFIKKYESQLELFDSVSFKQINSNIDVKKIKELVENHIIDHLIFTICHNCDVYLQYEDGLHIKTQKRTNNFFKSKPGETLNAFRKRKINDFLLIDNKAMEVSKKYFSYENFPGDSDVANMDDLTFTAHLIFRFVGHNIYSHKNKLYISGASRGWQFNDGAEEPIQVDDKKSFDFSSSLPFFNTYNHNMPTNMLLQQLIFPIKERILMGIKNKYQDKINELENSIRLECLCLRKKMNINYSTKLCESLINDHFNLHIKSNNRYIKETSSIFTNLMALNRFQDGSRFDPSFNVLRTRSENNSHTVHPTNLNLHNGLQDIEIFIMQNFKCGHISPLFIKSFSGSNTVHDGDPTDRYAFPTPAFEDLKRREESRKSLCKELIDKFQKFIDKRHTPKTKQRNIDWLQIELISFFEDNQKLFMAKDSKFKNFKLASDARTKKQVEEILFDFKTYEKDIDKLRKRYHKIHNEICADSLHPKERDKKIKSVEEELRKEYPKFRRFYNFFSAFIRDHSKYKYVEWFYGDVEIAQKEHEPFCFENLTKIKQILKKDQLKVKDFNDLRDWWVMHLKQQKRFNLPKFLITHQQKIFNMDDFFDFDDHFLDKNNRELKDLMIQLLNYINIDQGLATEFQHLIEDKLEHICGNRHSAHEEFLSNSIYSVDFPEIEVSEKTPYKNSLWWLIYNFISAQKSQIYHSYINSTHDVILRSLLFLRGIYPYRRAFGFWDPYERVKGELSQVIHFYDNVAEQIYGSWFWSQPQPDTDMYSMLNFDISFNYYSDSPFADKNFTNDISISAPLILSEITNSLRCIKDYITTLQKTNCYLVNENLPNLLEGNDFTKDDLVLLSKTPSWKSMPCDNYDRNLKDYLRSLKENIENKKNNKVPRKTGLIDKNIIEGKLKTNKFNSSLVDNISGLVWLSKRSGRFKFNDLKVDTDLNEDIGFNNFGLYRISGDTGIEYLKEDD